MYPALQLFTSRSLKQVWTGKAEWTMGVWTRGSVEVRGTEREGWVPGRWYTPVRCSVPWCAIPSSGDASGDSPAAVLSTHHQKTRVSLTVSWNCQSCLTRSFSWSQPDTIVQMESIWHYHKALASLTTSSNWSQLNTIKKKRGKFDTVIKPVSAWYCHKTRVSLTIS